MTLPSGWTPATLSDIATFNPKHAEDADRSQLASFVPMPAVDEVSGTIRQHDDRLLKDMWTGYTHFADGDVIFAKITPCMENGKVAIAKDLTHGLACGSTEFFVLRPELGVESVMIWRLLRQSSFRETAETKMTGAVGQRRVPRAYLESFAIDVPPTAEQRRIVAKLDTLTARLARARAELARVSVLVIELRRRTVKAALSGLLYDSINSPDGWSIEQRKAIERSRLVYSKGRRGSRLRAEVNEPLTFLKRERQGWLNCRLADVVTLRLGHAFKSADFSETFGIPLLRGANIAPGRVDWSDRATLRSELATGYPNLILIEGDIVLAMDRPVIASGLKLARIAAEDAGALLVQRVANLRPSEWISSDFLMLILRSEIFLDQIDTHSTGSDLPHISSNDILTTRCPLPPTGVQTEIVRLVEKTLGVADRLEAETARARALLDRLEAAILARAFRGELVPQDPDDEPASVLLDRIRARRAAAPKPLRRRRADATSA